MLPFFRPLRLLSLAVVVTALQQAVGHTIRGRVIVYTACGAVIVVYAAALAILDVEGNHPDAKIKTLGDALWWASTTVTTVGYGDLHPVTGVGRLVGVALMIGGITLLGLVTATLASWIVAARRRRRTPPARPRPGPDRGTPRGDPATREVGYR